MALFELLNPLPPSSDRSHHQGNPPTSFRNPWPSFPGSQASLPSIFKARFFDERPPFVAVPTDRSELVQIHKPDFNIPASFTGFRVAWIGHASFLVQCCSSSWPRPLNILLDPVFSERTSPVTFLGPKRYTPTPCSLIELLDAVSVDIVCISHNHYDHADTTTLKSIYDHQKVHGKNVLFCVALGNSRWLRPLEISNDHIWEADWWSRISVMTPQETSSVVIAADLSDSVAGNPSNNQACTSQPNTALRIICTPSQHASNRGIFDRNQDLWCSWALELVYTSTQTSPDSEPHLLPEMPRKALFFAGDTGYRTIKDSTMNESEISSLPTCPAFKMIGEQLGPFDLGLLPIGLCRPRHFMSSVHCNSTDSMDIHHDIKAKRSIGMHWGTVRGGVSAQYEDVRDPPREWKEEAMKRGLKWREIVIGGQNEEDWEIGLLGVGESLLV